ncbi:hypothetical protein BuS5_00619 [Desulfosarcina sp. BuS5]|uniref:PilW family protein n=1 Tax=Desulfosarcina sp. BuS5 TaxID=933262 RepID=UPI0004850D2B|nr:PilW family protein [Desulfosarcina sp. BuS5]WDN87651.1 hypothetical protein BuS5_00619 [Desulfosarcina sp. BuS5]
MKKNNLFSCNGFTLIELLIAMAITGIVSAAIFTAFQSQQKSYIIQDDVTVMQQNLRAGMDMMVREIRMAGYNPQNIGGLGILNVCPRDINNNIDITMTGNGAIQISTDFDDNGVLGGNETISFSICDSPILTPDGNPDLARNSGGGRQMLAENIEALGFAYAYDTDSDGNLDTSPNGNVIWAVDSDGDNDLDINLDTDDDGDIDAADGPGAGNNGIVNGTAIADVAVNDIRAVRIWMLARADRRDNKYFNTRTYVVGHKVITPNDNFRRRLLTTTVKCRNLGL